MSAEVYQMISMVAFSCGGVLTLIAIILFIKFDVPSLIGELSGRTAEKKVQEIRQQNRQAVSMRKRESERRRKVPVYATDSKVTASKNVEEATVVLDNSTEVLYEATTMLKETTLLNENCPEDEGTALLSEEIAEEQTIVLGETPEPESTDFSMLQDVVEVHTTETI